jgi:hypothetical protein
MLFLAWYTSNKDGFWTKRWIYLDNHAFLLVGFFFVKNNRISDISSLVTSLTFIWARLFIHMVALSESASDQLVGHVVLAGQRHWRWTSMGLQKRFWRMLHGVNAEEHKGRSYSPRICKVTNMRQTRNCQYSLRQFAVNQDQNEEFWASYCYFLASQYR